jgi:hypothetical protein
MRYSGDGLLIPCDHHCTPAPSLPARGRFSCLQLNRGSRPRTTEARARLEVQGYSAIAALTKGGDGAWRGTATRSGRRVTVGVDTRGNVGVTGPRD